MHSHSSRKLLQAFTLLELLVTVAVIAVLIAITIPVVMKARERAQITKSASNLRQVYTAFMMYIGDHNDMSFWRGKTGSTPDYVATEGMDWFVHGGKPDGNNDSQEGLFNKYNPRPLNSYMGNNLEIFRHPSDRRALAMLGGQTHYDAYGNDYAFNSLGYPGIWDKGLSGESFSNIQLPGLTILFLEAHLLKPGLSWAGGDKGNIMMADGRIVFDSLPGPNDPRYKWGL
ncbi:type II secretion system protein [Oscillatoria amoena NRMC-F 0135]|nr:type II secretion system protein [Oscillatoria amoena NRMC-F 0135]